MARNKKKSKHINQTNHTNHTKVINSTDGIVITNQINKICSNRMKWASIETLSPHPATIPLPPKEWIKNIK